MKSNLIAVISLKKLPRSMLRKYDFYNGNKILLSGYKRKGSVIVLDSSSEVEVWYYNAHGAPRLLKFLEKKKRLHTDYGYVFYVKPGHKKLMLTPLIFVALVVGVYFLLSGKILWNFSYYDYGVI